MIQATTDDAPKSGAITPAKMDAALKAKWVAALRSGKYKQAHKALRDDKSGGFCCLGVLCEVAGIPISDNGSWPYRDGRVGYVAIWELIGAERRNLPEMNDKGKSFVDLANYIEANL